MSTSKPRFSRQALLPGVRARFRGMPKDYSMRPFWHWNDDLREEEIARQLDEFKRQHEFEPMISTGVGLIQPYLSEAYYDKVRFTLREARRRGLRIWIYDEYCWPSGTAANGIPERYPEYRMPSCRVYRYAVSARGARGLRLRLPPGRVLRAWAEREGSGRIADLSDALGDGVLDWRAPRGAWTATVCVVAPVQLRLASSTGARWTTDAPGYVDTLNREAVAKYIELVYEGHYRAAPEYFGTTVPGFFTDEAGFWYDARLDGGRTAVSLGFESRPGAFDPAPYADNPVLHGFHRSLPWTHDLLGQFRARNGYDLRARLPELVRGAASDRGVAYDYFRLVSDLFAENFCGQIGAWCGRHKLVFTGHWSEGISRGDFHRQTAPQQEPGIDVLGGGSVFNKLIMLPRQVASVARIYNRPRVVAETYGVTKWDFEMADKVRDADLLTVLGINAHMPIDHAYSFRGFRKHTANPPGFVQAPAWRYQRYLSDRVARLCLATSAGRAASDVAVFYPVEEALASALHDPKTGGLLEQGLYGVFTGLLEEQVEADFVFESALDRARIAGGRIAYPGASYRALIMAGVSIVSRETLARLRRFVETGGTLVALWRVPERDPRGAPLGAAARALFGDTRSLKAGRGCDRRIGAGRVIVRPDPLGMITTSESLSGGKKECLFDGTDSLVGTGKSYPQWLAVDLGARLDLVSLGVTVEAAKRHIRYRYAWQVSDDGRRWRTVAREVQAGLEHATRLPGRCRARHVRLQVEEGGGRFFALQALTIRYREASGEERTWKPPAGRRLVWRELLGGGTAPLEFHDESAGRLSPALAIATRIAGADRLMAVMNRTAAPLRLTARLAAPCAGAGLELWDPDTGSIRALGRPGPGGLPVAFAPYECRVFAAVRGPVSGARIPGAALAGGGRTAAESRGPWPFRTERPNAFPLMAGALRMADPMHPESWMPAPDGTIPKPFRRAPYALFDCRFVMDRAPGGDETLLYEEGLLAHLRLNGRALDPAPRRNRYLDPFGVSVPAGFALKRGENRLTGWFMPEFFERTMRSIWYNEDRVQPTFDVYLLGAFGVTGNRIGPGRARLDGRPWQQQGYPYYSGTGIYTVALDAPRDVQAGLRLEADAGRGVVEARWADGGRLIGVRVHPPYVFDVAGRAEPGQPLRIEVRVTHTIGAALTPQRMGAFQGAVEQYASGLARVRLVVP